MAHLKLIAFAARSLLHSAVSGNGIGKYGLSLSCSVNSNLWILGCTFMSPKGPFSIK